MTAWAESIAGEIDGGHAVVGASMGGYCALALARVAPELVRGLLLVGSRPDPDSPERRAGRADTIELIRREGPDGLWRFMEPKLFAHRENADPTLMYRDPEGLIAALEAAPEADVVLVAHTGLDHVLTIGDVWRELPMDKVLMMRWWQVPRDQIPDGREAQIEWLFGWWELIDAWIAEHRPQELARGAPTPLASIARITPM